MEACLIYHIYPKIKKWGRAKNDTAEKMVHAVVHGGNHNDEESL